MPRAYSDDLRRKILTAHDRGKGTLGELAKRFDVSLPYVKENIGPAVAQRPDGAAGAARARTDEQG